MSEREEISFETLDPKASMTVSMIMMGVLVVGMIFFTTREAKKEAKKANTKGEKVNPYKIAKETGKSVEEIVAKEEKKKEKKAAAVAKKERHAKENKVEIASDNFKVSKPRTIKGAGAGYRTEKKKPKKDQKSKSTNPKNQSGKNKNKKKKK